MIVYVFCYSFNILRQHGIQIHPLHNIPLADPAVSFEPANCFVAFSPVPTFCTFLCFLALEPASLHSDPNPVPSV
uniref:Uncharacterized protein n=1 Tax=Picea sitchensis TaxID=3332 RepID=A0A6B9XTD5_PICSI|nr:hypothetical protein Q903MT_gene6795 [Picea sitchensis]